MLTEYQYFSCVRDLTSLVFVINIYSLYASFTKLLLKWTMNFDRLLAIHEAIRRPNPGAVNYYVFFFMWRDFMKYLVKWRLVIMLVASWVFNYWSSLIFVSSKEFTKTQENMEILRKQSCHEFKDLYCNNRQ